MSQRLIVPALTSAVVLLLAGCSAGGEPSPAPTAQSTTPPPAASASPIEEVEEVASNLDAPWSIVFLSDGTPLISERNSARILELDPAGSAREIGVVDGVVATGEAGLLGLAIDANDRLYAYSTGPEGNRIQRFNLIGEAGALSMGEPETIIDGIPSANLHDGGRIAFGPDGMLYW